MADHAAYYDQVAELYDTVVQLDFDIPFFLEEAQHAGGQVLELMSGSGRVSLRLIEAGIPLTCVDFSAGLLAILQRKLDARGLCAELHHMGVRDLALGRAFDMIFMLDLEDEQRVLRRVAEHLADGGRFICTLHNPPVRLQAVDRPYGLWLERPLPDGAGTVMLWGVQQYDAKREIVTVQEFFEVYDPANVMRARHRVQLQFRVLTCDQFEAMAADAGFAVEALYGNYDRSNFDPAASPFMIYLLRRT
jgi:SAM-dependent methyltransferase